MAHRGLLKGSVELEGQASPLDSLSLVLMHGSAAA